VLSSRVGVVPWLQEGSQNRLAASVSIEEFVAWYAGAYAPAYHACFLPTLNYDARSTTHQIYTAYSHRGTVTEHTALSDSRVVG